MGGEQHMEHVTVTGAVNGRYVISNRRPDGVLTLEPDTSLQAIRERTGTREPTAEEWAEFERGHGSQMLPPDGDN
jgi:hypothetical protein